MAKNQQPRPEEIWLWQTWYRNAAAPHQRCPCCRHDIDLGVAFWELKKSFRGWYIKAQCGNIDCIKCGPPNTGVSGICRGWLRFEVPIRKPSQAAEADYSLYNSYFPEQPSDEWRAQAAVLPRFDGVYQTEGEAIKIHGGYIATKYLRFNAAGQVFSAYSSGSVEEVAQWIGQPGLDYEATANSFSSGLYSVEKRKISTGFPPLGCTEFVSTSSGTISRDGTALNLETWATRQARASSKDAYKFRPIKGM